MRGFAKAGGKAGKVRGGRCWLPRDVLEGVPRGRLLRCLVEVEREFRGVPLAGLGGIGLFADAAYIVIPTCWWERETGDFCWGSMGAIWGEVCWAVAENGDWRLLRQGAGDA